MSIWSLTCQQRVFQRCHSGKNSSEFFYLQDGGKNQQARIWHDYYVTATLCIIAFMSRTPPMNNGYLEAVRQKAAPIETAIANTNPAAALTASRRRHDFRFVISFFRLYYYSNMERVVSVLDSRAEGHGFKSQSRCKLFAPIVPLSTKQQNW